MTISNEVLDELLKGCERHEDLFRGPTHYVDHDLAIFMARSDVQEHKFIGPFALVAGGPEGRDVFASGPIGVEQTASEQRRRAQGQRADSQRRQPGSNAHSSVRAELKRSRRGLNR